MPRIPGEVPCADDQRFAEQIIENTRKQPLKDPYAQTILEHWIINSSGISRDQAKEIGMLWLTKVLGVDEKTAQIFASENWESGEYQNTYQKIGYLHAGSRTFKPDARSFWEGVHEAVPEMVKDEDLAYLIWADTFGEGSAAWSMICAIDGIKPAPGFLTTHLVANALLYK